jgi:hypothetical protein
MDESSVVSHWTDERVFYAFGRKAEVPATS